MQIINITIICILNMEVSVRIVSFTRRKLNDINAKKKRNYIVSYSRATTVCNRTNNGGVVRLRSPTKGEDHVVPHPESGYSTVSSPATFQANIRPCYTLGANTICNRARWEAMLCHTRRATTVYS